MTLGHLETVGYTEKDAVQRINAFLMRPRSGLIDIRLHPSCQWSAQWNRETLKARYGKQYIHLPCFGNVNHNQPGKPISLANPRERLDSVVNALLHGRSLMLLCACKDYERCHRKTVYDLIMREVERRQAAPQSEVEPC
jgi:uncharacterized protein (DUF488 family)